MGRNRVLGSPFEQQTVSADFTTEPRFDQYLVDGTAGVVTVTLDPNAFDGDQVMIVDASGTAGTFPISLYYNGVLQSTINANYGIIQATYSFALGAWTTVALTQGGDIGLVANAFSNRVTYTTPPPAAPMGIQTSDGVGAVVLSLAMTASSLISRGQTSINASGYVGLTNSAGSHRTVAVNVETSPGTPIFTALVDIPPTTGNVVTVPFNADVPFADQTTAVYITVVASSGSAGDVTATVGNSNLVLQEVALKL